MADEARQAVEIINTEPYLKLRSRHTQLKAEHASVQDRMTKAESALGALQAERDAALSANVQLKADVERLQGQFRTAAHRSTFDRLAAERGVPSDSLDLVWTAAKLPTDKDQPDESAIVAALDAMKAAPGLGRLFGANGQAPPAPGHKAPGAGQGEHTPPAPGRLQVTQEMIRPGSPWMKDHKDEWKKALAENRVDFVG